MKNIKVNEKTYYALRDISERLRDTAVGPVLYVPHHMIIKIKDQWVDYDYDEINKVLASIGRGQIPVEGRDWFYDGNGSKLLFWLNDQCLPAQLKAIPIAIPLHKASLFHIEAQSRATQRAIIGEDQECPPTSLEVLWDFIMGLYPSTEQ